MSGNGKERFIEVKIKKRKKVNNQCSKICFVHTILSRIVDSRDSLYDCVKICLVMQLISYWCKTV